jgi:stress-induced morphogen
MCAISCSIEVVSDKFDGKKRIQRHQMVYKLLQEELDSGLHALSMKLHTPAEVA